MTKQIHDSSTIAKNLQPYICGGGAAMFAALCVHPIDLTKVRIQLIDMGIKTERPSAVKIVATIIKEEGVASLYSGLTASLMRQAVYGTARLGLHRSFSEKLQERHKGTIPFHEKVLAGFASGAIASIVGNPFDIALVRMQADGMKPVDQRRGYKNVFDAITRIIREEGPVKLWRGFEPTVMRAIAMNVGMMASYDQVKEAVTKVNGPTFSTQLISSAIAGFCCSFTSLPFDMIKTRLQNMKAVSQDGRIILPYSGVGDCALQIVKNEGPFAFWRGFWTYYSRCAPHAMIILLTIEQLNRLYQKAFKL